MVHHNTQVLFCKAALHQVFPQPVLVIRLFHARCRAFLLPLLEFVRFLSAHYLHPIKIPLSSSPVQPIYPSPQASNKHCSLLQLFKKIILSLSLDLNCSQHVHEAAEVMSPLSEGGHSDTTQLCDRSPSLSDRFCTAPSLGPSFLQAFTKSQVQQNLEFSETGILGSDSLK